MALNLQKELISRNIITLIIVNVACTIVWFLPFMIGLAPTESISIQILNSITLFTLPPLAASIVQYILWILIGIFINRVLEQQKVLSAYNYLFYYIFIILGTTVAAVQLFTSSTIAYIFVIIAFYFTLTHDNHNHALYSTFNSIMAITLATLFNVELVWLIPTYWIVLIAAQQMSGRGIITSIFSIFTFACILFGIGYLCNIIPTILQYYNVTKIGGIFSFQALQPLGIIEWIGISLWLAWGTIYVFVDYAHFSEYSISMRRHFVFYITVSVIVILIYLINTTAIKNITPIMVTTFAFFTTIFYRKNPTRLSEVILLIFLTMCATFRIVDFIL